MVKTAYKEFSLETNLCCIFFFDPCRAPSRALTKSLSLLLCSLVTALFFRIV